MGRKRGGWRGKESARKVRRLTRRTGVAEDRGSKDVRPPRVNPLHQIEIDDFRRDRLLAALALILGAAFCLGLPFRSEEHTSELQSLMRISYAVFCLKKKKN